MAAAAATTATAASASRTYETSSFFPLTFIDGNDPANPVQSASAGFGEFRKYQENYFVAERISPVHYTASMPDFQVFSGVESSLDEKRSLSNDSSSSFDHLTLENRRSTRSPISFTMGLSSEAPARLNSPQRFLKPFRQRAVSLSILEGSSESFVTLENTSTQLYDLPSLVSRADVGLKYGVDPILAEGAMGGTYFLRDRGRLITVVCKPGDEEPNSPYNPYQDQNGAWGAAYKGRIIPGFGMYREVAAFILDDGFSGVPPTALAKVRHRFLKNENHHSLEKENMGSLGFETLHQDSDAHTEEEEDENFYGGYKLSSVQSYVRHEGCAEDLGPCMFDEGDILRIAVLDIRLCNLDRHGGNILVCQHQPYVNPKYSAAPVCASLSSCRIYGSAESFPLEGGGAGHEEDGEDNGCHRGRQGEDGESIPSFPFSNYTSHPNPFDYDGTSSSAASSAPSTSTSLQIFFDRCNTHANINAPIPPPPTRPPRVPRFLPKSRLVPIDHGYCLPHVLHMSETAFTWLNWSQVKGPVPEHIRQYVAALDYNADVELLRRSVGAAIPETSLLTLRVCTLMLQLGVAAGLSLHDLGTAMSPERPGLPSPLHAAVKTAVQAVVRWERQMGPHNFQKHNIRYPRPFAPHQSSTSTASSVFPSHSGSACAWASAPPTLFPSFFSPALHATFPEPPSPSLSPHYQSSPTFFQRDITPCASFEMGRLFDASMSTSHSHSYERQEEEYSPLNRQTGTVRANEAPFDPVGPPLTHPSDIEIPAAAQSLLLNPAARAPLEAPCDTGSGTTAELSYTTSSSGSCRSRTGSGSGLYYRASTGGISESSSGSDSGTGKESRGMEEEMTENELENSYLMRGKSCPVPHSPSSSSSSSPRGVHRFHHTGGSRDINGIAHTRNAHTSTGHISVNDDTLAEALLVHGGKLLVEELERAVTLLVEQMRLEKQNSTHSDKN